MIFMILILVILVFVLLWNFDVHKILFVKFRSQNGGDAAAIAAGQWQGISLNLLGDLNVMRAVALMETLGGGVDTNALASIDELQARLCYVGPMIALLNAQQAAKNNGIHNNDLYTAYLNGHVSKIRNDYPEFIDEAYPGCLEEYATMLEQICASGIAAGPDNMQLYSDHIGGHTLLDKSFYDAIASRSWCWFYFNEYDLLQSYSNYIDWAPLPEVGRQEPINSEFFSLHVAKTLPVVIDPSVAATNRMVTIDRRRLPGLPYGSIVFFDDVSTVWYCYDHTWMAPFAMSQSNFPAAGDVVPKYDYAGADAAIRIETEAELRSPGAGAKDITWTAAAKPFGYLNEDENPTAFVIVLPAFHDICLIPVDAASGNSGGGFDLQWREHCEKHLPGYEDDHGGYHPGYMQIGPAALSPGCKYCRQLRTWENAAFRQSGLNWLKVNSRLCHVTEGGGGSGGMATGGTRRGH
jgi:hypothetical protein